MKPLVSICSSACRVKDWKAFADSLKTTGVPYEIVFVGPYEPIEAMPDNFRFIKTEVKPCQCYHISYLKAKGDIIVSTADDVEYQPGAINRIFEFMMQRNNKMLMGGFRQIEDGRDSTLGHIMRNQSGGKQLMSPFPVFFRETYFSLGGYDRRFITGQMENDFTIRLLSQGGKVEICMDAVIHVKHEEKHKNASAFRALYEQDRAVFESIWFDDNRDFMKAPRSELQPFENTEDLLVKSQGTRGEWP